MSQFRLNVLMAVGSALIFLITFVANEWVYNSEFVRGINWVYLPAGMRLLCSLLFGGAGAIGVMVASWITCVFYFFPDDPVRSFVGGIISAAAPYLVYRGAQHYFGLRASLTNLTTRRLLFLIVVYSVASPSLHHLWFLMRSGTDPVPGIFVMIIGDLTGTLLVVYTLKMLLAFLPAGASRKQ
jgi:hypothetical protein